MNFHNVNCEGSQIAHFMKYYPVWWIPGQLPTSLTCSAGPAWSPTHWVPTSPRCPCGGHAVASPASGICPCCAWLVSEASSYPMKNCCPRPTRAGRQYAHVAVAGLCPYRLVYLRRGRNHDAAAQEHAHPIGPVRDRSHRRLRVGRIAGARRGGGRERANRYRQQNRVERAAHARPPRLKLE